MAQKKTMLYVGGLAPEVSEEVLHAAFIPFGEIKSLQVSSFKITSYCIV